MSGSNSSSKALDLLFSWEASGTLKDNLITTSVLSAGSLWEKKVKDVLEVISAHSGQPDDCVWALDLLAESIGHCSDVMLKNACQKWTHTLTRCLQSSKSSMTVQAVCNGLASLLDRVHQSHQIVRDFPTTQLASIMQALLWFTGAEATHLQVLALQVVSRCLVHFTAACSQYRTQLKKWAVSGLFDKDTSLSQECCRVIVLLCYHSNQQWSVLAMNTITAVQWVLDSIFQPVLNTKPHTEVMTLFEVPPLPLEEPDRSSLLLRETTVFSRLLYYVLVFPPSPDNQTTPPAVPLEKLVGVVSYGLSIRQEQVSGQSTEMLLLHSMLPVVHTAMWNVMGALVKTCHTHLLPYSCHIDSALVMGLSSASHNKSISLCVSIHRVLCSWVAICKDCDHSFIAPIIRALLSTSDHASNHTHLCLSSLRTISSIVQCVGPILPASVSPGISRLPLDSLSLATPPDVAVVLVELLLGCVTSGNHSLTPPLSVAIQLFSELCTLHASTKVVEVCKSALTQCSILQHPAVVPFPSPQMNSDPTGSNTDSSSFLLPQSFDRPLTQYPQTAPQAMVLGETQQHENRTQNGEVPSQEQETPIVVHVPEQTSMEQRSNPIGIEARDELFVSESSVDQQGSKDDLATVDKASPLIGEVPVIQSSREIETPQSDTITSGNSPLNSESLSDIVKSKNLPIAIDDNNTTSPGITPTISEQIESIKNKSLSVAIDNSDDDSDVSGLDLFVNAPPDSDSDMEL